jgi:hypothetical protein
MTEGPTRGLRCPKVTSISTPISAVQNAVTTSRMPAQPLEQPAEHEAVVIHPRSQPLMMAA